jgi:aldehyde:ferredoxin oxidoreductase
MDVGGYAGKILRVDLTMERVWTETRSEAWYRKWLGGTGFGAALLWEEVPPEADWDDPENRLVLATGPVAGTPIWGSGSLSVVTRGTLTHGATSTQAQGFFGSNLKSSGYDAIVVQGRAPRWVYLYIEDDRVELRDASILMGRDTWETQDLLQAGLGMAGHRLSVYSIGPAGENLVKFAAIAGDYGHVAAKNGCGAVMGAKRLKAVAIVRGSKPVRVPDPRAAFQLAEEIATELKTEQPGASFYNFGTIGAMGTGNASGIFPIKNYTTSVLENRDSFMARWEVKALRDGWAHTGHQCNACGMKHCRQIRLPDGPHAGQVVDEPEYEGFAGAGLAIGATDPVAIAWLNTQVDRACVDVNEFGWVIGWTMECLEKGYLTPEEVGLNLKWGDVEGANALLTKISRREGFGDLLAEGVKNASETVGGAAADCAIYTLKGAAPRGHDHRSVWLEMLDTCVSSTGTIEGGSPVRPTEIPGQPAHINPFDPVAVPRTLARLLGRRHVEDSIGMCNFTTKTTIAQLGRAVATVTGWDYDFAEARTFGLRVAAILRAFNMRCGLRPEDERPSVRYGSTPVDGPAAGVAIAPHWEAMRREFYLQAGYDLATGKPTAALLERVELPELIAVLWGDGV